MGWFSKPSDIQIEALYMAYNADTIEVLGKPQTQSLENVLIQASDSYPMAGPLLTSYVIPC